MTKFALPYAPLTIENGVTTVYSITLTRYHHAIRRAANDRAAQAEAAKLRQLILALEAAYGDICKTCLNASTPQEINFGGEAPASNFGRIHVARQTGENRPRPFAR